jgi:hypothetical protein
MCVVSTHKTWQIGGWNERGLRIRDTCLGKGMNFKCHRSFGVSPNDKRSSASFLPLTKQDEGIEYRLNLKDSKMPNLARFTRSGHDFFIFKQELDFILLYRVKVQRSSCHHVFRHKITRKNVTRTKSVKLG